MEIKEEMLETKSRHNEYRTPKGDLIAETLYAIGWRYTLPGGVYHQVRSEYADCTPESIKRAKEDCDIGFIDWLSTKTLYDPRKDGGNGK